MKEIGKNLLIILVSFCLFSLCALPCKAQERVKELTLEEAIEEAIQNNSLIRQAIEQERAAVEGEKSARADLFPTLSTSYSYTRLKNAPFTVSGPMKIKVGEENNISWDVMASQPLFTGFAISTRRKIAALDIDFQEIVKEQAVLDIARLVKIAYFNLLLTRRALEVADEEVKQLEGHVHDAKALHREGVIPLNDLLKSQVALAHARQGRVQARANLTMAVSKLNTILGRDIMEDTRIQELPPFQPTRYEIAILFEEAIQKRPEVRQLNVALKQAGLAIRMAKSSYYPQVYLVGRYEQIGDDLLATNNDFGNDHNLSLTLQATWRIFQWGKKPADVKKAMHERSALEQKIRAVKDSILLEVRDAYQKLRVAEENIHTATEALDQARENFRITNLQYQEGMTTSTEVLDARTFLTQAEVNYYNSLYGYRIADAELKRALGQR
ncbi:MAG: TolC family protein [Deltaproteobacteria bacterium]|nr:TolC family protein [Deltaproteobacteria bacterium]MBW2139364.1 TolC family protein [Deltaproteobacteria bacterium]